MNLFTISTISLLALALLIGWISAILSLLVARFSRIKSLISGVGGMLASLVSIAAAVNILANDQTLISPLPLIGFTVELSPLNALMLLTIALPVFFCSLHSCVWLNSVVRPLRVQSGLWCNLLITALIAAVVSANGVVLILTMELATLCAYFLIMQNKDEKSRRAGLNQFLSGRLGTLCLILAFGLLYSSCGSVSFAELRISEFTPAIKTAVFLVTLLGFGLYAGIIPLHAWVPQSHSSAPAHAAALFSSAMMKVGILGLLKISLDLLGTPPLWWGILVLLLAGLTAFIGGLYALMEHDLRRLLAYHSLENVGIILLGIGGAMAGMALNMPSLAALALLAGLFHLFNHGLFKTALFLGAGEIEMRTGIKDIEKLGGIARQMPWTAIAMLIALMSMAALPPLNGFASEWLIYQSLFQLSGSSEQILRILAPLLAVGLALTGALALMCIAKVFGVTFLGAARCSSAANAVPAPFVMTMSSVLLALLCIVFGVASPWLTPVFLTIATSVLNSLSEHPAFGFALSPSAATPMLAILLLTTPLLPWVIAVIWRRARLPNRQRGEAWSCGYGHSPEMVVTSGGFTQPLRVMFTSVYRLRQQMRPVRLINALHQRDVEVMCRRMAFIELVVLLIVVLILRGGR